MIIKTMDKKEIKQLLKSKPVDGSFNVFKENDGIIKIYKDPMFELERYATVIFPGSQVQEEQIYWLESKQPLVKGSNLPNGIVYYERLPIGVMYPKYFEGYKNFYHLHEESVETMIRNFRTAIDKNMELIRNGIFNFDFTMHNILYKGNDVQLIDLDGKYVTDRLSVARVYSYFVYGMMNEIYDKVKLLYGEKEALKIIRELTKLVDSIPLDNESFNYPHTVLDEVEKTQILKLK